MPNGGQFDVRLLINGNYHYYYYTILLLRHIQFADYTAANGLKDVVNQFKQRKQPIGNRYKITQMYFILLIFTL